MSILEIPLNHMRRLTAAAVGTTMLLSLVSVAGLAGSAQAASVSMPSKITAVTATAGPKAGEVTFHWKESGAHTSYFQIETALSSFKAGDAKLPTHGRDAHIFKVAASHRSLTLTAAQVAAAGASVSSANHLYYRFKAVHTTKHGTAVRNWPYQQSVAVKPATPATDGTALRIASFNVRSAKVSGGTSWLHRAPLVAKTIIARDPGIVAVQELGPGRADGKDLSTVGAVRQTDSLVDNLQAQGVSKYALVRTTSFLPPGVTEGSQGARILYDTTRFQLLTDCPETTGSSSWSASCSIPLPILSTDPASVTRRASYAEFEDIATGERFWVASLHLDSRQSTKVSTEKALEALRGKQMATVIAKMKSLNTEHVPVFINGDLNSWQNNQIGDKAHDALIAAGYYDTAAATTQINTQYTTSNDFIKTIPINPSGWGARLDVIMVQGITGASRFENVMTRTSTDRASDHNMIVADVRFPVPPVTDPPVTDPPATDPPVTDPPSDPS